MADNNRWFKSNAKSGLFGASREPSSNLEAQDLDIGSTTYANNAAALAAGKNPGDIIALTNAPGGSSLLAVVVEAVPPVLAQYSFIPCTEHPEAGPAMFMSTADYELLAGVLGVDPSYFFITDNEALSDFKYCYKPDPTYTPGTTPVNIDVESILAIPTLGPYVDCATCETAHPIP